MQGSAHDTKSSYCQWVLATKNKQNLTIRRVRELIQFELAIESKLKQRIQRRIKKTEAHNDSSSTQTHRVNSNANMLIVSQSRVHRRRRKPISIRYCSSFRSSALDQMCWPQKQTVNCRCLWICRLSKNPHHFLSIENDARDISSLNSINKQGLFTSCLVNCQKHTNSKKSTIKSCRKETDCTIV